MSIPLPEEEIVHERLPVTYTCRILSGHDSREKLTLTLTMPYKVLKVALEENPASINYVTMVEVDGVDEFSGRLNDLLEIFTAGGISIKVGAFPKGGDISLKVCYLKLETSYDTVGLFGHGFEVYRANFVT